MKTEANADLWTLAAMKAVRSTNENLKKCRHDLPLLQAPLQPPLIEPRRPRDPRLMPPEAREALRAACTGTASWPVILSGPPGNGKTSAALCVADRVPLCVWYRFPDFYRDAHSATVGKLDFKTARTLEPDSLAFVLRETSGWTWKQWFGYLEKAPLVVLDDIGCRGSPTEFQHEAFKHLIDVRYGLPLILTTNHDLKRLDEIFGDRITDRLAEGTFVPISGPSMR